MLLFKDFGWLCHADDKAKSLSFRLVASKYRRGAVRYQGESPDSLSP